MADFIRRTRPVVFVTAVFAVLLFVFVATRFNGPAIATSGGDPYLVPIVTDTNPDSTIVETTITAQGAVLDIGNSVMANVLTFNGTIPGPEFRLHVGDTVIVHYQNNLGHASGIHWHGIQLDNASDGTPLTQNMVPPGGSFLYKFKVTRPGIYWYHPHHHSSTNQVFKGLYGSIIVTDPNEAALQNSGTLPPADQTRTMVLSDLTVCKTPGSNDTSTFQSTQPWLDGTEGPLPAQPGPPPMPNALCELAPVDEDGVPRVAFAAGDVPNIQPAGSSGAVGEGQTVLTNGLNVGGRAGSPFAPGALDAGAHALPVQNGQGVRLQIVNTATVRFFRLKLTDNAGVAIPLVRVGGQGGLLDAARTEGGIVTGFDFRYGSGEILIDPGGRADVVFAVPPTATGVLTLWTKDFERVGPAGRFTGLPSVPVAHFNVLGSGSGVTPYTIAPGTPLRAATGDPQVVLGPATASLLDPATFAPPKPGMPLQDIQLTNSGGTVLGVNGIQGQHDVGEPYSSALHPGSTRYATLGDRLELTVTNVTGAHHPFHLHGFSIQPLDLTKAASPTYTYGYAEYQDNIDVPGGYTLRFRVKLDDRFLMDGATLGGGLGRWVFHCHIFFHASFGMISEFDVVAPDGNERPYINANGTVLSGAASATLTMHGTYVDPDGDAVTLSASSGTITDDGGGVWTWTGRATASRLVYVTATDTGGKKDQVAFQLIRLGGAVSDFDNDGKSDMTVFRPSTGGWHTLKSSTTYTTSTSVSWGLTTDVPAPGDYDGDGKTDPAIFRPSTGLWAYLKSSTNFTTSVTVSWGLSTDLPVPADYDGDGKTDPAVYRPSTGGWYVLKSSTNYTSSFGVLWGLSTDQPLPADYDGDGRADPAIYRPSTGLWAVLKSNTSFTTSFTVPWGLSTDVAVPGEYDGDGKTDPAVYRPSTGGWYILKSSTNYTSSIGVLWGLSTDVPVPADYDGDGKFDPAIFRPSTGLWAILKSATNYTSSFSVSWGLATDTPINRRP